MAKKTKLKEEKETKIDKGIKKYFPFVIGLAVLAVIFIVLYFAFQDLGKVKYEGLTFIKEKYGDVQVYHYYYLTQLSSGKVRSIDIFLRGNPAENKVPVKGEIVYPAGKTVYISINGTGLKECTYNIVAIASLTGFLVNNELNVKAGTPDKEEAKMNNSTHITCATYPSSTTLAIRTGSETKITRVEGFCYDVEISNCEILPALEKFIVQSIIDAKKTS